MLLQRNDYIRLKGPVDKVVDIDEMIVNVPRLKPHLSVSADTVTEESA